MENYRFQNYKPHFSGDVSIGQEFNFRSGTANATAFARYVRAAPTSDYSSMRESPRLTDNRKMSQNLAAIMAMTEVGKDKKVCKPTKGLIDNKQITRRKDVNGSRGTGKWHEFNGPRGKSPCAGCHSFNFHKYKGVS